VLGDIRASLYDVFGYLFPGIFAASALFLIEASLNRPGSAVDLGILDEAEALIAFLLGSYILGHLTHSIGNITPYLNAHPARTLLGTGDGGKQLSVPLQEAIDRQIRDTYRIDPAQLTSEEKYVLADEGRVLAAREGEREVYVYREGFYRGMAIATALLTVALVLRVWRGPLCVEWPSRALCADRFDLTYSAILGALSVLGFVLRMRRFGRYRVERALLLWLTVSSSGKSST
jgi:hypothetical protein